MPAAASHRKDRSHSIHSRSGEHTAVSGMLGPRGQRPQRRRGGCILLAVADLDWSRCPAVERVPGKVSGAWVLKGTRMPVATIFENLEAGARIDDVLEWYEGLDRKQVQAVIEFAARSLDLASTER